MKKTLGLVLIIAVLVWDADAMKAHVVAHSWLTLAYVSIFFIGHLVDYLTIGRIVNRMQDWGANYKSDDLLEIEFLKAHKAAA